MGEVRGYIGDARTYENACALRIVESLDGMTADWGYLDHQLLRRISNRIINEVRGIHRWISDPSCHLAEQRVVGTERSRPRRRPSGPDCRLG